MGTTSSANAPPQQAQQPPPQAPPPNNPQEGQGGGPQNGGQEPTNRQAEFKDGVIHDPQTGKYFDPYSGQYVVTPGHYDPRPQDRPLRVKVKKHHHVRLRKKRRQPKPERIPDTPPPPPPQPPVYYDEYGQPLPPEYDDYGHLVEYDEDGNVIEKDEYGYYIDYDEFGQPMTPDYRYDVYGNIVPYNPYPKPPTPPKPPKYNYPDDGYDYDNDTYTFTTVESTPTPTPSPISSDEVQEKSDSGDDSMEDVDDFYWRPPRPLSPPRDEARALLKSGGEGCRCFPHRSDPGIPSMVYEQVTCPHNNSVIGHMHGAVYRFDENWDDDQTRVRRPRRPNRHQSRFCMVWGYPKGRPPTDQESQPPFQGGLRGEFRTSTMYDDLDSPIQNGSRQGDPTTRRSREATRQSAAALDADKPKSTEPVKSKPATARATIENPDPNEEPPKSASQPQALKPPSQPQVAPAATEPPPSRPQAPPAGGAKLNDAPVLSREKMERGDLTSRGGGGPKQGGNSRASIVVPSFLPRIGYTPEKKFRDDVSPSPQRTASRVESPLHLPPIPQASTPGSLYSRSMSTTSAEFGVPPDVNTERNFQGKYYDPATQKTYTYDIKANFGINRDKWNAVRN